MQGRELGPSFAVAHHPWHVALQGREGQTSPGRGGPTPDAAPQHNPCLTAGKLRVVTELTDCPAMQDSRNGQVIYSC